MTRFGAAHVCLLACAVLLTNFFISPAWAQATYQVQKGEGLLAIATKLPYRGVSRFQTVVAIYRANQEVFPDGNINVLREGQVLKLPRREEIAAISPAEASSQWRELTAKPAAAVVASIPAPAAVAPPALPKAALSRQDQVRRYREGLQLERRGDDKGALQAFLEAGEAGYGLAQRRLGEIYDKGNSAVARDYETALKWYQRAREQGVEIPKPFTRSPR